MALRVNPLDGSDPAKEAQELREVYGDLGHRKLTDRKSGPRAISEKEGRSGSPLGGFLLFSAFAWHHEKVLFLRLKSRLMHET